MNFDMRAKNMMAHNRSSHTASTQQRNNMIVMYNTWKAAAEYVRAQKGPTHEPEKEVAGHIAKD